MWLKLAYSAWVALLLPTYWQTTPLQLLWSCNVALLVAWIGLWLESSLLVSMAALAILWWQRRINQARVLTLGIKSGYRASGVDALLYHELHARGHRRGYPKGEFSWILEDNLAMRRPLENMGGVQYKTYRIYDRPLAPAPAGAASP